MKLAETRWVNVVWCDDIRQEVGNKPSLMGVYTGGLAVPSLPVTLPRLAAWINVQTPKNRPFERLNVRIQRNDTEEPVAVIEIEEVLSAVALAASQTVEAPAAEPDQPSVMIMSFVVLLGALQLNQDTQWFKVFVETEDEILESFKLPINTAPAGAVSNRV